MRVSLKEKYFSLKSLLQRLNADFLEEDYVVVAVILQAEPTFVGTRTALGFKIEFLFGDRLAFGVIGDFYAVDEDDGVRRIERDFHGVPFGSGLAGFCERLVEGIKSSRDVSVVFIGCFRMIIDLNFVAVVDGHPGFAWLDGNADVNAGVVIHVAHFENDAEFAFADFSAGTVGEAHAAVSFHESVFDGDAARADVFPAGEIFSVEEWFPFRVLGGSGKSMKHSRERHHY